MSKTVHSVKLQAYDAVDLNRLSYSNGDLVYDSTNNTIRIMNGVSQGGVSFATQPWVLANTLTQSTLTSTLTSALNSALSTYAPLSALTPYATITQLNTAISGVSNTYTLPTAGIGSGGTLGGVKVDGTTITINGSGVISGANTYVLPKAQAATGGNTLGGVIPDGTTITIDPSTGIITGAQLYTLPAATTSVRGGIIVPAVGTSGLTNSSGTIGLATASNTQLGGVKVDNSTITISSGVISAAQYTLPAANTSTLGGVIVPITANSGLTNSSGTIRLVQATTTQLGGVKVDGTTITIAAGGQISAVFAGAITFVGAWNAATNSPALANGSGTNGNEYICSAAGTVNFGNGNITFSVGDAVIYNGTLNQWIRIPASSALANLTFATSGGVSSGTSYNGTGAVTIDYSTLGASPLAGSTSLTTLGTISAGTWNGGIIGSTYGGTGVNNGTNTLTLAGSLTTTGAFATTIASTAATSVTLPTSGTIISSVTALGGAVSGTPSSTTYLRGDGTWATISAGVGLSSFSITTASASSTGESLSYNTSNGVFTFTPVSFVSPPAIGGTTPNSGAFSSLSSTTGLTLGTTAGTTPLTAANAATGTVTLTTGTTGQFLTSSGANRTPYWSTFTYSPTYPTTTTAYSRLSLTQTISRATNTIINWPTPGSLPTGFTYSSGTFTNSSGGTRLIAITYCAAVGSFSATATEIDIWFQDNSAVRYAQSTQNTSLPTSYVNTVTTIHSIANNGTIAAYFYFNSATTSATATFGGSVFGTTAFIELAVLA